LTLSPDFPTASPIYGTMMGDRDAFVTKIDASGSFFSYSTYLGGNDEDYGNGIAVDSSGNAYITGSTNSADFPTVLAFQGSYGGSYDDAFITKINPSGSSLVYSSFLGGGQGDRGYSIAVDAGGNAYVTGWTDSPNFPTTEPIQGTFAGEKDAFVTKIDASGSLDSSTFFGGNDSDFGRGIAVDGLGNAYVTGYTTSPDFPTVNPLYPTYSGSADAFIAKISDNPAPEWTFFVYLGADNSLSPFADADLDEMQQVGSDSNVNVVTLVDQIGDHDTHFYKVEYGSLTETPLSEIDPAWIDEVDMSDPNTLITSANYVIDHYPANRYCIVLWNHGDGWRKEPKKLVYRAVIEDNGNMMRMDDVGHALSDVKAHLGSKIDLVGFDACLMGMIEVAYEIRDHAKVMVGSEDLIGAEGWPYDTILEDLVNDPAMDSETFARNIVDRYAELCDGTPYWTLSALRLNMAYDLAMLIDDFADSLTSNWDEIRLARSNSQEFAFWYVTDFHEHIDLYDFCSELNTVEAQAVMGKVDDMVINERHDSGLPDSQGVAIYFPVNQEDYDPEYHASPDHQIMFPVDTSWDEFLARYYGKPIPDIKVNNSDGPIILNQSDTLTITVSLDNNNITDNADWWLAAQTPFGLYFYTFSGWVPYELPVHQGPLFYLEEYEPFSRTVSGLQAGTYTFYFGVDTNKDEAITWGCLYYDTVEVNITE